MKYRDRYDEPAMLQKYNNRKMDIWICEKSPAQRACRDLFVLMVPYILLPPVYFLLRGFVFRFRSTSKVVKGFLLCWQ